MRNGDWRLTNQDFCRQIRQEQPFLTTVRTNTVIIIIATVRKYVLQQESNRWKQICQEKIQNWWIQPEASAQPPWKLATAPFVWSQRCCLISHFCISAPNPSDLPPVELCRNYPRLPAGEREEKQPLFLPARRLFCLSRSHN